MSVDPKTPQRRVVVIPTREVPLTKRERWFAFGMGAITGMSAYLISWLLELVGVDVFDLWMPIFGLVFLIWPTRVFRRHCIRLAPRDTVIPFNWYYSLGVGTAIYVRLVLNALTSPFQRPGVGVVEWIYTFAFASLIVPAVAVVGMGILPCYEFLLRLTLPRFVTQDGTLCPNCGYCLLGVQSMRCPECGNAFTYEDLETTEGEFRWRSQSASLGPSP